MSSDADASPLFTVGHSTRTIEAFVSLLQAAGVTMVIDVRKMPRSRTNPQFNEETLPAHLARYQIGYRYIAQLGGLRGRDTGVAPEVNALWRNRSFHNYADYALGPMFHEGMATLQDLTRTRTCAIMCSEAVWWRCHRRIIADHWIAQNGPAYHLMGADKVEPAHVTEGARLHQGLLTYPAAPDRGPAALAAGHRRHHLGPDPGPPEAGPCRTADKGSSTPTDP
jgi:uncharacterized protein (DUF488 family)